MDWSKHSFKILNALATPVLLVDRSHTILGANNAACTEFCLSTEDLIGNKCFKVAHKLDVPCWQKGVRCPTKAAFELKRQTKVVHKHFYSGKTLFEQVIASPVFGDHEEVEFVVEEYNDVTELIQSKEIADYLKRDIKTLKGLLPICSKCKKIRNDKGYWNKLESYFSTHLDVQFTHALCQECMQELYGEEKWYKAIEEKKKNKNT